MWNTFQYTVRSLIRERNILIWALLFPLVLSTLFSLMFSELDEMASFSPIKTAIVDNDAYRDTEAFAEMIDSISAEGDDQMIVAHFVSNEHEAQSLLEAEEIEGYILVDENSEEPVLRVADSNVLNTSSTTNQTILKSILDRYVHMQAMLATIGEVNPLAFTNPALNTIVADQETFTEEITITANDSSPSVRYFYALLGFASIMTANVGLAAITRTQANLSALGARRAAGATSRAKTLLATLAASWLLSFACLFIAFCYMRFILNVDFGGRDALCILGLVIASLMTTALGACIGSIPKISEGSKNGILTGLSCGLAIFAGLYGEWCQKLADDLARNAPLVQLANPARQVADLFYSLFYYDSLTQFASTIGVLLIMATVLFAIAAVFMRRQRYANL